jgi:hypothetical protein
MRGIDRALAFLAASSLAGAVAAHGVHDLRGEVRVEPGHLQIEIDTEDYPAESRRCLRLLDELHVRDARGKRLVGTEHEDETHKRCRLEYRLGVDPEVLALQVRSSRNVAPAGERLVLQPSRDGSAFGDVLVLTTSGNIETLNLSPGLPTSSPQANQCYDLPSAVSGNEEPR